MGPSFPRSPIGYRGAVFSINFVRHETVPLRIRRTVISVALGSCLVNASIMVGLIGMALHARQQWQQVQAKVQRQMPSAVEISATTQEMETLHERAIQDLTDLNAAISLHSQRFPIGGKLAALTKTLPARTWITGLSGNRENRTVTIQAIYLIDLENPYDLPTKEWIEALKADPHFRQGLTRLDLGTSSRTTEGRAKLFSFELVAEWEPVSER
jgi:Tfp pilus assembly protein PilN